MNELKHVDDFLKQHGDKPASELDFLQHWKYIKRERKKGKWVYTYPNDKNGSNKTSIKDVAKDAVNKVKDKLGYDEKAKAEEAKQEFTKAATERAKDQKKAVEVANRASKDGIVTTQEEKNIDRALVNYNISNKKTVDAAEKYADAKDAYSKTPIAKIETAVNKGKSIANKVVDTITKPIQKEPEPPPEVPANPIPGLNLKTDETTRDEDMSIVNPEYSRDPENLYNENCAYCTLAYDLRRRGYDVEAGAEIDADNDGCGDGMTPMEILECYENTSYDKNVVDVNDLAEKYNAQYTVDSMTKAMEKDMLSQGEGARGHLCLYWAQGGGHDVIWEVENGKVVVRDCQTNEKLKLMDYTRYCSNFGYIRTDNLTPNETCKKYVRNRKE